MVAFQAEEARRGVIMEPQSPESFALIAQKGKKIDQWQTSQPGGVAPKMEINKGENKDSLWYTFCKKRRPLKSNAENLMVSRHIRTKIGPPKVLNEESQHKPTWFN